MDKKFLFENLRDKVRGDIPLQNKFYKKIQDENFLKDSDEIFSFTDLDSKVQNFIVLKELTEKIREKNENFLYAFEETVSTFNPMEKAFGFLIKSTEKEDTYVKFYGSSLESLIRVYDKKNNELLFIEIGSTFDGKRFKPSLNDIFTVENIDHFKAKFYYQTFKGDYLEHYLKENNLKIKNLLNNIFY